MLLSGYGAGWGLLDKISPLLVSCLPVGMGSPRGRPVLGRDPAHSAKKQSGFGEAAWASPDGAGLVGACLWLAEYGWGETQGWVTQPLTPSQNVHHY